jgi:peptide deformylase
MAVRKILKLGDPLLRRRSVEVPVSELRSKEIKNLIRDMRDTMKEAGGIGLAAPQIGVLKRVVIVGFEKSERYPEQKGMAERILINPVIEALEESCEGFWEGCLSVPGMRGYVERPRKIRLTYYDTEENRHEEIIEGFEAVVYQHECDHLDGILYVDRLKSPVMFGYEPELNEARGA